MGCLEDTSPSVGCCKDICFMELEDSDFLTLSRDGRKVLFVSWANRKLSAISVAFGENYSSHRVAGSLKIHVQSAEA
jgi:hypothetical protein